MRLFCAIPFPPDVRAALAAYQRQLREAGAAGNFTRPENLHLTLAFLGETGAVRPAAKALAAAADRAFPLTLAGSGRFGDVFWVGVTPCPALEALAGALQQRLRDAGFALEDRPFRPHITLLRRAALPPQLPPLPPVTFSADRIVLFESAREGGRLVYRPVQEKRLRA